MRLVKMADVQPDLADVSVEVQYVTRSENVPEVQLIRSWVEAACRSVTQKSVEILVRLVDIQEIQKLNRQFRDKDKPTNVLSFSADIPDYINSPELGDIVICADVVQQEAKEQNKQLQAHWAHMIVHGVLHLSGYDHQHEEEAEKMEQIETEILAKLGFPDPYNES